MLFRSSNLVTVGSLQPAHCKKPRATPAFLFCIFPGPPAPGACPQHRQLPLWTLCSTSRQSPSPSPVSNTHFFPFLSSFQTHPYCPHLAQTRLCLFSSVHAKSRQSCPALCHPMDCSPPGSSVHGILQARILEKPKDRGTWQATVHGIARVSHDLALSLLALLTAAS